MTEKEKAKSVASKEVTKRIVTKEEAEEILAKAKVDDDFYLIQIIVAVQFLPLLLTDGAKTSF